MISPFGCKTVRGIIKSWAWGVATAALCSATLVSQTGVGIGPFGMANNCIASPNGVEGLFWNPAGLAFSRMLEMSGSVEGMKLNERSEFYGMHEFSEKQLVRLENIGIAGSGPVGNKHIGFGLSFLAPYTFLDRQTYHGKLDDNDALYYKERNYRTGGSLYFWSLGGGIAVSRNFAIGATISMVNGFERVLSEFQSTVDRRVVDSINDFYETSVTRSYHGYDVRLGMLLMIPGIIRLGGLFVMPGSVGFHEDTQEDFSLVDSGDSFRAKGHLESSFSGGVGLEVPLKFIKVNADLRFRAPYDGQPDNSLATYWKLGGGVGVEVPIRVIPLALRCGYSYDEFDPYVYLFKYRHSKAQVVDFKPTKQRQLITAGVEISIEKNVSLEAAYGFSFWELSTPPGLTEKQHLHRISMGFDVHY